VWKLLLLLLLLLLNALVDLVVVAAIAGVVRCTVSVEVSVNGAGLQGYFDTLSAAGLASPRNAKYGSPRKFDTHGIST
jgi:hypothetical protein